MNPAQRIIVIPMTALVNNKIQPLFVTEAFPRPTHADGVRCYRRMGSFAKHGTADSLPSLTTGSFISRVSGHDPYYVMGAIASFQITNQANHFFFRQSSSRNLPVSTPQVRTIAANNPWAFTASIRLIQPLIKTRIHGYRFLLAETDKLESFASEPRKPSRLHITFCALERDLPVLVCSHSVAQGHHVEVHDIKPLLARSAK